MAKPTIRVPLESGPVPRKARNGQAIVVFWDTFPDGESAEAFAWVGGKWSGAEIDLFSPIRGADVESRIRGWSWIVK